MDVEKTVQFLLEQQAASAARMGELHTIVEQMAINQVALGKAQTRFDANMKRSDQRMDRLEQNMERADQRMGRLEQNMERADQRMDRIEQNMDRLVNALNGRFGANGSVA